MDANMNEDTNNPDPNSQRMLRTGGTFDPTVQIVSHVRTTG